jgi:Protein of unknown function (DUF1552)
MKYLNLSRRTFLGAGLSTAAAAAVSPFLPISERHAEAQGLPKRLLLVFWCGGSTVSQDWPVGGEADFTFPSLVSSLAPYKNQLIILKNLRRGMDGSKGSHQGATGGVWSGARAVAKEGPGPWMSGPSINQIIINKVKQPTPFQTIDLDCQSEDQGNLRSKTLFDMAGHPMPGEQDPSRAFDRIFTDGVVTAGADPKIAERLRNERKSVLDLVDHDLNALKGRLGGQDKIRLEQHLEALRSIEQRISPATGAAAGVTFKPPTKTDFPKIEFLANDNYPKIGKMHIDLAVSALASDRSRIVTLQFSQGNGDIIYNWLGVKGEHHALTHGGVTTPALDKINQFHFEQFAYLLGQMSAVKEGNGTLLDNTVVVFANELHDGYSHTPDPSQVFLAGSGGGYFKTGRQIIYPAVNKGISGRAATPNHSQLLVSLCQYMGVDINQVADPSIGPGGPLALLR